LPAYGRRFKTKLKETKNDRAHQTNVE